MFRSRFISFLCSVFFSVAASSQFITYLGDLKPLYLANSSLYTDNFYTTSPSAISSAVGSGAYTGGVTLGYVVDIGYNQNNINVAPLRRTFKGSPVTEHFYTTSTAEFNAVTQYAGYVSEGIEGGLFTSRAIHPELVPVHRLWKTFGNGDGVHVYLTNDADVNYYLYTLLYRYDRIEGYVFSTTGLTNHPGVSYACQGMLTGLCYPSSYNTVVGQGVCTDYNGYQCDSSGAQVTCGGVVTFYSVATGSVLGRTSPFSWGSTGSSTSGCRASMPTLFTGNGTQVRAEYSGFAIEYSTSYGARSSFKVIPPGSSTFTYQ
jgi:hypothetical protein